MSEQTPEVTSSTESEGQASLRTVLESGRFPVKLVTGSQQTTGLNFNLKPGAIVAHPNSTVLFVCG